MAAIHEALKELRKSRGLSLREASERSGVSHSYISTLESGGHLKTKFPIMPSPDTLERLAKAYNASYEELMICAGYMTWETDLDKKNPGEANTPDREEYVKQLMKYIEPLSQLEKKRIMSMLLEDI